MPNALHESAIAHRAPWPFCFTLGYLSKASPPRVLPSKHPISGQGPSAWARRADDLGKIVSEEQSSPGAEGRLRQARDAAEQGVGTPAMGMYVNGGKEEGSEETINNPGMPAAPAPAQSGMSRTPPAATWNVAAHPGALVEPPLSSSTHPAATWNGAACTDCLAAYLYSSSGGPTPHRAVQDGALYPDTDGLIMEQLRSGAAPTAPWNALACPDMLTAHLAPDVSPAAWNHGAYPDVAIALDTNALGYVTGEGAAGQGYYYYHHSGDKALPFAAQVVVHEAEDSDSLVKDSAVAQQDEGEVAGAVAEPVRGGGGLVGVGGQLGAAAVTLAVAGLTAGGAVNPSTALPLFLMLTAGVTMVTVRVVRG